MALSDKKRRNGDVSHEVNRFSAAWLNKQWMKLVNNNTNKCSVSIKPFLGARRKQRGIGSQQPGPRTSLATCECVWWPSYPQTFEVLLGLSNFNLPPIFYFLPWNTRIDGKGSSMIISGAVQGAGGRGGGNNKKWMLEHKAWQVYVHSRFQWLLQQHDRKGRNHYIQCCCITKYNNQEDLI